MKHPVADAVSLAVVAGVLDETQRRIFGGEGLDDFCDVVAGAVIDDDNLSVPPLRMNEREDLLERGADASTLVVGRDDDAIGRVQRFSLFQLAALRNAFDANVLSLAAKIRPVAILLVG